MFKRFGLSIKIALPIVALLAVPATGMAQHAIFDTVNNALAAEGHDNMELSVVEWFTAGDEVGQTIFFNNRGNKQLAHHWVPNDPRNGNGTVLPWAIDGVDVSGDVPAADQFMAIGASMQTWQDQNCSFIPLVDFGLIPFDYGFVQYLLGHGGTNGFFPFLTHAGFLPGSFFEEVTPGGSGFILGVTFTFTWTTPADMDNNGKADTALREIYYNDTFGWGDGTNSFDIETVSLHEVGHGLSQGHFGKAFRTTANGELHFAPRAVMNAGYSGVQRSLGETDNGGHCSIWDSWPNN
jgi:hypothetical protein